MLACALLLLSVAGLSASDWPQWQGPDRTRLSKETGLLKEWPAVGPRVIWTAGNLGSGYGSMSVAGDRVFVQGARGPEQLRDCTQPRGRQEVWAKASGPIDTRMRTNMGAGPRGTPTVDGDRLYVLTENGDLACLKTDGSTVWQLNILKEFGASQLPWMVSESPLVDGAHVVVSPGGPGAGIVKLDKMTGKTVWTSKELSDTAGYSSITVGDVQGVRTYMTFTAQAGVGVRASDGKLMFRHTKAANNVANIATPVFFDNKVFFTSGYGAGGALLSLSAKDGEVAATEVYHTTNMRNHHGGVVLVDGYLYGFSDLILTCLEFSTGNVMWRDRSVGKGSGHVCGRPPVHSEREQHVRPGRGIVSGIPREGAILLSGKGSDELGPSGHQRRPFVRPQSGHAAGVRH
jgi:outer membrane protein assembly factor BamB